VLRAVARGWAGEREKLVAEGTRAVEILRAQAERIAAPSAKVSLSVAAGAAFEQAFSHCEETFDPEHGGFGGAPKFPRASVLNFLFRCAAQQGLATENGQAAVRMAVVTLQNMARGGLHDHVGGGYHRYSVDERW